MSLRITRSFTFLLLALALAGCELPDSASSQNSIYDLFGEPDESDDDAANDDDARPDDDASDDDDAPESVCDGIDRDEDWDCDGIPDYDVNGDRQDILTIGPDGDFADTVGFHMSTVDWANEDQPDQVSVVGFGFGGDDDWDFLGINPDSSGSWWDVALEDGDYRLTLRGAGDDDWADYDDYCRYGVEDENGDTVYDPACCLNPDDNAFAVVTSVQNGVASPGDCDEILQMEAMAQ